MDDYVSPVVQPVDGDPEIMGIFAFGVLVLIVAGVLFYVATITIGAVAAAAAAVAGATVHYQTSTTGC